MTIIQKSTFRAACCFILPLLLFFTSHVHASDLSSEEKEYLRSKDTIVFVCQTHYPPFEFTDENRQHEGMMLDVVRWVAVEMGFKSAFMDMTFQQAQEAVLSGKADILTSLFYSDQRKEKFAFTQPLFDVPASIFVKAERTDIKDIIDLSGKTISIQRGDYARDFLESRNIPFDTLDTKDFLEATNMVLSGKADAIIGDEQIVFYHIFSNRLTDVIKKVGEPLYIGKNCMASNLNNALLIQILNKGISNAEKSGQLDKIRTKWLGTIYSPSKPFLDRYRWHAATVIVGILLILSLVWVWNIRLRSLVRKKTADITRTEKKLIESEENFRVFFETLNDLIFVGSPDGKIFYANPAVSQKLGYCQAELENMNILDIHPAEKRREAEAIFSAMFKGELDVCPLPLQNKTGLLIPVETRVWFGKWNGADCIFGISNDLTKEQEALQKFNKFFYSNPALMAVSSISDKKFTNVNDAFLNTLGFSREDVLGKTGAELGLFLDPEKQHGVLDQLKSHGQITNCELRVRCKDGTILYGLFSGEIIESQGQAYFLTVMVDQTKRKLAEFQREAALGSLRESEQRYRVLVENAIDLVFRTDATGHYTFINPAVIRTLGYASSEILGEHYTNFIRSDMQDEMKKFFERQFVNRIPNTYCKLPIITKDGREVWLAENTQLLFENDQVVGFQAVARNITEQRRSEELLRKEYAFRNAIIDNVAEGLCVCHETTDHPFIQFTIWNNRMTEITGYTMEEINHMGWYQTVYPDPELQAKAMDRMKKMYQREYLRAEGWEITHADGINRVLSITTSVVESDDGLVHIMALMQDITERKRTHDALQESETRYRLLAENATDIIWTIGMDLRLIYTSPSVTSLLGFAEEEAMARTIQQAYTPAAFEKVMQLFAEEMAIEGTGHGDLARSRMVELELVHKNGNAVPVEGNFSFLRDPTGKAIGILAIVRDISNRKKADDKLKAALQEKEILLREIHHRVKNNMQVISSLLNLQADRMENEHLRQAIFESQQRIAAMAMIHETLYGSQNLAAIDLSVYLKRLVHHLQEVYSDQTEVYVAMEMDDIELNIDQAVPCGLILNELITNAFKYAFPGGSKGTIQIKAHLVNDYREFVLEVSDNGVGFTPGLNLKNPSSLGLRLVQGLIAHQLKGSLDVATEGGTVFTLRWPLSGSKGENA